MIGPKGRAVSLALLALATPAAAPGQAVRPSLISALADSVASPSVPGRSGSVRSFAARGPLAPIVLSDTTDSLPRRIHPTHWKEGALVGGLVGGAAFAVLGYAICHAGAEAETDCSGAPVAGFVVGGFMGGLIGALIGGQFPKEEEPADPGRPE